jgi:uridine kinase
MNTLIKAQNNLNPIKTITEILLDKFQFATTPICIAIGGPGGVGKSTFSKKLVKSLPDSKIIYLDNYKTSRQERKQKKLQGPHPEANNISLLIEHLDLLKRNKTFSMPIYNRDTGEPDTTSKVIPSKFNILDGEISTYKCFLKFVDFSIFIDADIKTQLMTRLTRDVKERGHSLEKVINTFLYSNLTEFPQYGAESKSWADIRLFCGEDYEMVFEQKPIC